MLRLDWHKTFYIAVLMLSLTLIGAGLAQDDDDDDIPEGCPRSQGYWVNHPDDWVDITITIGSTTYTQDELLTMMPGGGDATQILLVQLVAAKLNIATGTTSPVAEALVMQAEALLAGLDEDDAFDVAPSSAIGQVLIELAGTLDDFNSGLLVVDCPVNVEETPEATPEVTATIAPEATAEATPEATAEMTPEVTVEATAEVTMAATAEVTPEMTPEVTMEPDEDGDIIIVIEGPVQSININIITIYNINIVLQPDEPLLTVIRIGDIIRVEGELSRNDDDDDDDDILLFNAPITIIAITIIIVDVDVVVNVDGSVWRDYGDCSNSPPSWAPASGWRARCEVPDITINIGGGNQGGGNQGGGDSGGMGMGDSGSGS